jgi:uncharacterized membrane protein
MIDTRPGLRTSFPFYAIVIGFIVPFALGAMLSDWRYMLTYEIQWLNMADWMVTGSLSGGALAFGWTLTRVLLRGRWRDRPSAIALSLLLAFLLLQFINALVHAKDHYASMPAGMILSVLGTLLGIVAAYSGIRNYHRGVAA